MYDLLTIITADGEESYLAESTTETYSADWEEPEGRVFVYHHVSAGDGSPDAVSVVKIYDAGVVNGIQESHRS